MANGVGSRGRIQPGGGDGRGGVGGGLALPGRDFSAILPYTIGADGTVVPIGGGGTPGGGGGGDSEWEIEVTGSGRTELSIPNQGALYAIAVGSISSDLVTALKYGGFAFTGAGPGGSSSDLAYTSFLLGSVPAGDGVLEWTSTGGSEVRLAVFYIPTIGTIKASNRASDVHTGKWDTRYSVQIVDPTEIGIAYGVAARSDATGELKQKLPTGVSSDWTVIRTLEFDTVAAAIFRAEIPVTPGTYILEAEWADSIAFNSRLAITQAIGFQILYAD